MSRRATTVMTAVLVLAVLSFLLASCGTASPDDFVGDWEEPGGDPPSVMHIESAGDYVYAVTYERSYPAGGRFHFRDGELVYAPVSPEFMDVITCDVGADTITITNGSGKSYTLSRAKP